MADSPETLRRTIAATQDDLRHNLDVLEAKGQDLVDWRAHVDKHPLAMLGLAAVGGALVAAILGGGRGADRAVDDGANRPPRPPRDPTDTWNRLRTGLGVAAAGVAMDAISKALPGLKDHVLEPVRTALRPTEPLPFPDRRFNGIGVRPRPGEGYIG